MSKLYLGIEIGNEYSRISRIDPQNSNIQNLADENNQIAIPSMISLDVDSSELSYGSEALLDQGMNRKIVLHKLEDMFHSRQSLSVEDKSWHVDFLLKGYLEYLLDIAKHRSESSEIESVALCLDHVSVGEADRLKNIFLQIGLSEDSIHVIGKQEALFYFLLSKKKEIWNNTCFLFDYSKEGLWLYETKVLRGVNPMTVTLNREELKIPKETETGSPADSETVDLWLTDLIKDMLDGRIVSSVLLCGEGFQDFAWAGNFIREIRAQKSRKVYQVESVFTMGAALAAYHLAFGLKHFPYNGICEGRSSYSVSMEADRTDGKKERIVVLRSGISCNEAKTTMELNLIKEDTLVFFVKKIGEQDRSKIAIKLDGFIDSEKVRSRISLSMALIDEKTMLVRIVDLGFGEIFPSSGKVIQKIYDLATLKEVL